MWFFWLDNNSKLPPWGGQFVEQLSWGSTASTAGLKEKISHWEPNFKTTILSVSSPVLPDLLLPHGELWMHAAPQALIDSRRYQVTASEVGTLELLCLLPVHGFACFPPPFKLAVTISVHDQLIASNNVQKDGENQSNMQASSFSHTNSTLNVTSSLCMTSHNTCKLNTSE